MDIISIDYKIGDGMDVNKKCVKIMGNSGRSSRKSNLKAQ